MAGRKSGFYKRGKIWWVRTDPITGRAQSTGCRDFTAAKLWHTARERRAADPAHAAAETATLGEWCRRLMTAKQGRRSPETMEVYRQKLGHWIRIAGEDCTLGRITPGFVDEYVSRRRTEHVGDFTIGKEITALTSVLRLAQRAGAYPGSIGALRPLDLDAVYRPRTRALSRDELAALQKELAPERAAFVALAAGLGLRLSELFSLRPSDLSGGVVRVRGTKTEGAVRPVPVLSAFAQLVEGAWKHVPLEPWGNVGRDLKRACARAGIAPCTPNDLRRTFATLLIESGVDRDVARRFLGHTTAVLVDRTYGQPRIGELTALAERALQFRYTQPSDGGSARPQVVENANIAQLVEQRFRKAEVPADDTEKTRESGPERATGTGEIRRVRRLSHAKSLQLSPGGWSLALAYADVVGRAA